MRKNNLIGPRIFGQRAGGRGIKDKETFLGQGSMVRKLVEEKEDEEVRI